MNDENRRYQSFVALLEMFERIEKQINEYESIPRMYEDYLMYYREIHTIAFIGDHEGTTATEISKHFSLTKSTVSHLLKKLKDRGFLRQVRNDKDAKIQNIYLTEEGKKVYTVHSHYDEQRHKELYSKFSEVPSEEISTCVKIMEMLIDIQENDIQKEIQMLETIKKKGYIK